MTDIQIPIGSATLTWTEIPTGFDQSHGWSHSGVAVVSDGSLFFSHPQGHCLIRRATDGTITELPTPFVEHHSLLVGEIDGTEVLWVADNGSQFVEATEENGIVVPTEPPLAPMLAPNYGAENAPGRVAAIDLQGNIVQELVQPDHPAYAARAWSPSSIAIEPGTGNIWVTDGYGAFLVHRYDKSGKLLRTIDGSDTGTTFVRPHGLFIRTLAGTPELYIADRNNARIVVYTLEGDLVRIVGAGDLTSPSSFAELNGTLIVTELWGSLALFDGDTFAGHVAEGSRSPKDAGWPNTRNDAGEVVAPPLEAGKLNSPHGIVVHDGGVYLIEWLIGNRLIHLV